MVETIVYTIVETIVYTIVKVSLFFLKILKIVYFHENPKIPTISSTVFAVRVCL